MEGTRKLPPESDPDEERLMKRKPIKINWDELESAFDNKREDLVYYLDLVTGQVVLEGEGEEAEFENEQDLLEEGADEEPVVREETTRLVIEPPGPEDEVDWMEDFVDEAEDASPEVREALTEALESDNAPEAFRDVLRHHAPERDRWFLYRSERLHEAVDAWLDANEVHCAEPPPWR
jgi:hypothetical protein